MKHAGQEALDELEDLLEKVRRHPGLRERKRGAFYLKSAGFLHFHEDPAGLFADLKIADRFERFRVSTGTERKALLTRIEKLLKG
jgi:hypothetical protein